MRVNYIKSFLRITFFLYFLFIILSNNLINAQNKNIIIKGKLDNTGQDSKLFLYEIDLQGFLPIDSFLLKRNGNFIFDFSSKEIIFLLLRTKENGIIKLAATPGDIITIKGNYNDLLMSYTVEGSKDSEIFGLIDKQITLSNQKYQSAKDILEKSSQNNIEQINDSINILINNIYAELKLFLSQLIYENSGSVSCLIAINQMFLNKMLFYFETDLNTYLSIDKQLIKYHAGNKHVLAFHKNVETYLKFKAENDAIEQRAGIGIKAHDISLFDTDSNKISLFDLKGKVVLIKFWNPSCDICRDENKKLKEIYFKNKDKGFEVFAVSIGTKREDWIYAINEDDTKEWINIKISEEGDNIPNLSSFYVALYGVKSIPYSFLIDRNGYIINKGFKIDVLDELLQDILQ